MNKNVSLIRALLLLTALLGVSLISVVPLLAVHGPLPDAVPAPPLVLRIERVGAPADPLSLRATLSNQSDRELVVPASSPLADYELAITSAPGGDSVGLSRRGQALFRRDVPQSSRLIQITLPAGGDISDVWSIDDLYEFHRPGKYRIIATKMDPTGRSPMLIDSRPIRSNVLEVFLEEKRN